MYDRQHIVDIDRKYIWHPFTQQKDYEKVDPVVITRGEGVYLYDEAGNRYYDTISSWWVNILGHCNPRINEAAKRQLDTLEHVNFSGFTHPYATELIEELRPLVPEQFTRYFFSDNGSTAMEVAIKMAFQYYQNQGRKAKKKFAMLNGSYHGDTLGATSVGAVDVFHALYKPLMFESIRVEAPYETTRKNQFTLDYIEEGYNSESFEPMRKALTENAEELAAVVVEPLLQGASGMNLYHPQYLLDLRELCDELDILIICDEVATGFGRTGKMFSFQHAEGFVPDILGVAKALTGGYMPMSLTITSEKIYNAFYGDVMSTFFHGHSYTANPLACAVAKETVKILKETGLPESNQDVIDHFHKRLREWTEFDFVSDIRYLGFFGAIDIVKDREAGEKFSKEDDIFFKFYQESYKEGIILRPIGGKAIYWCLPLIVTKEDIDEIMDKSLKVVKKVIAENV